MANQYPKVNLFIENTDNYDEDTKPTKNSKTKSNKVNLRKMVNKIMSK